MILLLSKTCIRFAAAIDLPENAFLYGDSGYTDYSEEDNYAEIEHIYMKRFAVAIVRKSNSLRQDSPAQAALKDVIRKQVENTFAQITARFPKKIHAVTAEGFILKECDSRLYFFYFLLLLKNLYKTQLTLII